MQKALNRFAVVALLALACQEPGSAAPPAPQPAQPADAPTIDTRPKSGNLRAPPPSAVKRHAEAADAGTSSPTPSPAAPGSDASAEAEAPTESEVERAISAANHCKTTADCVDLGGHCPFGCQVVVNASEAPRVRALIEAYPAPCVYRCAAPDPVACVEGRCEAKAR